MSSVVLAQADLALFSDLTQRVALPRVTAATHSRKYAGTTVQFEGDDHPTPFVGDSQATSWQLTVRFFKRDAATHLALRTLIATAASSPDSRLLLRTHYGQTVGLDEATAVLVLGLEETPQQGLYTDVSFTAEAVQFTLEV